MGMSSMGVDTGCRVETIVSKVIEVGAIFSHVRVPSSRFQVSNANPRAQRLFESEFLASRVGRLFGWIEINQSDETAPGLPGCFMWSGLSRPEELAVGLRLRSQISSRIQVPMGLQISLARHSTWRKRQHRLSFFTSPDVKSLPRRSSIRTQSLILRARSFTVVGMWRLASMLYEPLSGVPRQVL
jgi:hypothetical protein